MNFIAFSRRLSYMIRGAFYRAVIVAAGGRCGPGLRVESGLMLRHGPHKGIAVGRDVYLGIGTVIDCPSTGAVIIGDGVTLTHGVFISAAQSVSIGNNALIGEYVSIRDADHQMELSSVPIRHQPMVARGCVIEADVWIGRGAAILSGARLREGCVIGANAVVKGDIPMYSIAVGIPAGVVSHRRPPLDVKQEK